MNPVFVGWVLGVLTIPAACIGGFATLVIGSEVTAWSRRHRRWHPTDAEIERFLTRR